MPQTLAGTPVQLVENGQSVRYKLPVRPLGLYRVGAVPFVIGGLVMAGLSAYGFYEVVIAPGAGTPNDPMAVLTRILIGGGALLGFFVSILFILVGLSFFTNCSEIELTRTELRHRERMFVIGWSKQWPLANLAEIKLLGDLHRSAKPDDFASLELIWSAGSAPPQPFITPSGQAAGHILLRNYPEHWLAALAEDIAGRMNNDSAEGCAIRITRGYVDSRGHAVDLNPPQACERPAKSRAVLERTGNHVTITMPPSGLLSGVPLTMFMISIGWSIFIGLLIGFDIRALFSGRFAGTAALVLTIVFLAFGLALLLFAVHLAKRRAIIDVVDGTLLINITGLFGVRQYEWAAEDIERIIVAPSGITYGGGEEHTQKPVMNLQVHLRSGRCIGLLTGRDEDELRWTAWIVHGALGLDRRQAEE